MREVTTGPDLRAGIETIDGILASPSSLRSLHSIDLLSNYQLLLVLAQCISVSSSPSGCVSKLSAVSAIFSHLKYGCAPRTGSRYSCLRGFRTDSRTGLKPLNPGSEPDKLRM